MHATLQPALSVGQLVGWSVTLYFFYDFISLTSLLLPKWSGHLKNGSCPPARDFGSCVSGLIFNKGRKREWWDALRKRLFLLVAVSLTQYVLTKNRRKKSGFSQEACLFEYSWWRAVNPMLHFFCPSVTPYAFLRSLTPLLLLKYSMAPRYGSCPPTRGGKTCIWLSS